jgi:signal transduction histidine kinase
MAGGRRRVVVSLRLRLTLSYLGFFAVALLVLHGGLYIAVRQALLGGIDNELRLGVQLLQQGFTNSNATVLATLNGDRLALLMRQPPVQDFEPTNLFAQVYQSDGVRVASSPNLALPLDLDAEVLRRALAGETLIVTAVRNGYPLRELVAPLRLDQRIVGVLHVARSLRATERASTLLLYAFGAGGVLVLLAAARGGAWITSEDLSRRVPVPAAQDELQRLSVTVNELLERLQLLFDGQRRFVADVSHELRTPLAAMRGNLDILARGAARDPGLLAESIGDMRREVARLIRMTNDLLLLARREAGIELRHEPVELESLLLEVHRELLPLAVGVELRIGDEDQIAVVGDRDRLKQALLNLSVNALQHTPAGGSVTLSLARERDCAALIVSDTGTGIAAAELPRIFDRFYRADQSRSRDRGGAGLGLAIVRWIAEAHGGAVRVASTPGVGTTFTLLIPCSPPAM